MQKCSYADKYKAIHPPRCNNGNVCEVCWAKWTAAVTAKRVDTDNGFIAREQGG